MVDLTDLRRANVARDREWAKGGDLGLAFHTIELGGECGELLNKIKKVLREEMGLPGSRTTKEEIETEMGDVLICLDLVAMKLGVDLNLSVCRAFNEKSEGMGFTTRL